MNAPLNHAQLLAGASAFPTPFVSLADALARYIETTREHYALPVELDVEQEPARSLLVEREALEQRLSREAPTTVPDAVASLIYGLAMLSAEPLTANLLNPAWPNDGWSSPPVFGEDTITRAVIYLRSALAQPSTDVPALAAALGGRIGGTE